jgi:hypothetical protein
MNYNSLINVMYKLRTRNILISINETGDKAGFLLRGIERQGLCKNFKFQNSNFKNRSGWAWASERSKYIHKMSHNVYFATLF